MRMKSSPINIRLTMISDDYITLQYGILQYFFSHLNKPHYEKEQKAFTILCQIPRRAAV
jgi:hypothetical protein